MRLRRLISIALFCVMMTGVLAGSAYAENTIAISIDGDKVSFNDNTGFPYIDENSRTQVPFRVTLEKAGAQVTWDSANKIAIAEKNGIKVEVPIGTDYIRRNGVKVQNDTVSLITKGRTFLPIRIVMEALGYKVTWDKQTKTVLMTSAKGATGTLRIFDYDDDTYPFRASYGYFNEIESTVINGRTFSKVVVHGIENDSMFPASEFYVEFQNDKAYDQINFSLYVNKIGASGLGTIEVIDNSDGEFKSLKEIQLGAGECKDYTVDISNVSTVWVYFSLDLGSEVTLADLVAEKTK